jgi:hypothetical protein
MDGDCRRSYAASGFRGFDQKLTILFSLSFVGWRTLEQSPSVLMALGGDENASCAPAFTGNRKGNA